MYTNSFTYGNWLVSLDKVKFTISLDGKGSTDTVVLSVLRWLDSFENSSIYESVELARNDLRLGSYRFSSLIKRRDGTEGSFYIAVSWNGNMKENAKPRYCKIEFNPNKDGRFVWDMFQDRFKYHLRDVKSCDIAYDIEGYHTRDVFLHTASNVMTYGRMGNETIYISPKADTGRVKIYNKGVERGLDYDLLRVEVTLKGAGIPDLRFGECRLNDTHFSASVQHLNDFHLFKYVSDENPILYAFSRLSGFERNNFYKLLKQSRDKLKFKEELLLSAERYDSLHIDSLTFVEHVSNLLWEGLI